MKKTALVMVVLLSLAFAASSVSAQVVRYPLGNGNVAVKVDYFRFLDSSAEDLNLESAVYVGIEAYVPVFMPWLYLGMETGWAGSESDFRASAYDQYQNLVPFNMEFDANYVPIEFNAKGVFNITDCLIFEAGGGISLNYFDISMDARFSGDNISDDKDAWLFGGQFFAGLNYKFAPNFYAGANIKYQITDEMTYNFDGHDSGIAASNFRAGAQVGYTF